MYTKQRDLSEDLCVDRNIILIVWEGEGGLYRDHWRAVVSTVMNLLGSEFWQRIS
jgi:hypothetical protein